MVSIQIVKVPLERRPPDLPPDFPPLHNLRLEFLEDKKKLKPGLPLIPLNVVVANRINPITKPSDPIEKEEELPITDGHESSTESNVQAHPELAQKPEIFDSNSETVVRKPLPSESSDDDDREMRKTLEDASATSVVESEDEDEVEDEPDEVEDDGLTPEEREEMEKEEYLFKFDILRKKNKAIDIPVFTRHTPIETMKRSYNAIVRRVHLDSATETYRHYMIAGFLVTEFVCTKWIGIDLSGFAKQQISIMYKYDSLLIELGEKTYSPKGSNLPVELRLVMFVIMQAGIFYVGKMLTGINGTDTNNTMNAIYSGLMGNQLPQTPSDNRPKPKGPSLTPEDIKRMNASE